MHIIQDLNTLKKTIAQYRNEQKSISFVPTMGALHTGHLSLIEIAKKKSDIVVSSIFVNPKQFAPNEDLDSYPRTEQEDIELLKQHNTTITYLPKTETIYPDNFATSIHIGGDLHKGLCSKSRPHFFDGVALVVLKLFLQIQPDIAVFGEKDYQQLCIITQMVKDLDLPISIIGAPIVRESDGLAMSSRNKYLSTKERTLAPELNTILNRVGTLISKNHHDVHGAIEWGKSQLEEKGFNVDYLELRQNDTLTPLSIFTPPCRLLVAATLNKCRLLDNIQL